MSADIICSITRFERLLRVAKIFIEEFHKTFDRRELINKFSNEDEFLVARDILTDSDVLCKKISELKDYAKYFGVSLKGLKDSFIEFRNMEEVEIYFNSLIELNNTITDILNNKDIEMPNSNTLGYLRNETNNLFELVSEFTGNGDVSNEYGTQNKRCCSHETNVLNKFLYQSISSHFETQNENEKEREIEVFCVVTNGNKDIAINNVSDFTENAISIICTDPYFFEPAIKLKKYNNMNYQKNVELLNEIDSYVKEILKMTNYCNNVKLKRLIVICGNVAENNYFKIDFKKIVKDKLKLILESNGLDLVHIVEKKIHDRVWINYKDDCTYGLLVGSSINGLGVSLSIIVNLKPGQAKEVIDYLVTNNLLP